MTEAALEQARALLATADPAEDTTALLYDRWFHATTETTRTWPGPDAYTALALAARPFEPGWVSEDASSELGVIRARRGIKLCEAPPLSWAPADPTRLRPAPGEALLISPWRCAAQGGFWHLWSPVWPARPPRRLTRWYFQVAPEAEPAFVALLAGQAPLERAFAAKLLTGTHRMGRRDTAVLYAPAQGAAWLDMLLSTLAPCLVDLASPPFTEVLAQGISRADDPGDGQSFGQHRCALLAAVAQADRAALGDAAAWRAAVAKRFAAAGLSLDHPWRRSVTR